MLALCLALSAPTLPAFAAGDAILAEVVAGDWRKPADRERDAARNPIESLTFWGLAPGMHILEVQPGAGWWTDILAPYAQRTGGRYGVTKPDLDDPDLPERAREMRAAMAGNFADQAALYGPVEIHNWGPRAAPLPVEHFDFALVSRSFHGWMRAEGMVDRNLGLLFAALKPGGILALEQHRADPGEQDPAAASGYVTEAYVIAAAERAGFRLDARSEVNANPRDTKDHPFGVWTLPPTRRTVPYGTDLPADPDFDSSPFDAIGESDRMTLRFVKPN
jgi:predicted methyltransferase